MNRPLKVLFLCTGNSCRSQMAEGWARALWPATLTATSAGLEAHGLNPRAVEAMAEADVDISDQRSRALVELLAESDRRGESIDVVVTVCDHARESCPVFPRSARVLHQSFDDPPAIARATGDESLEPYRRVRDEIRDFVARLPEHLSEEGRSAS